MSEYFVMTLSLGRFRTNLTYNTAEELHYKMTRLLRHYLDPYYYESKDRQHRVYVAEQIQYAVDQIIKTIEQNCPLKKLSGYCHHRSANPADWCRVINEAIEKYPEVLDAIKRKHSYDCPELIDYIAIGGTEYVPGSNANQSKELKELKDALKEVLTFRSVSDAFQITDFAKEVMKKLG